MIRDVAPAVDVGLARELLVIQHAAYAVEAALIGDDRIPALHEDLDHLRHAPLLWLGAFVEDRPVGAIAWAEEDHDLDIDRLIVAPAVHRRGTGVALVSEVLRRARTRRTTVSTGRDNVPARALYSRRLGFSETGEREVIPGLWVTQYAHVP